VELITAVWGTVCFSLLGAGLGTLSGLIPGIHVNTLALMLFSLYASSAPFLLSLGGALGMPAEALPLLLSCTIVSACVVHSFLDFIPSVFLGAPDDSDALSVLPGHRLLLAGRGMEAVHCAAVGSAVGTSIAILLALPIGWLMGPPLLLYDRLLPFLPHLLVVTCLLLIISEREGSSTTVAFRVDQAGATTTVSLAHQVPVDGSRQRIFGVVESGPVRRWVRTPYGVWRLKGEARLERGPALLEGVWEVRSRRWWPRAMAGALLLLSGALGFIVLNAHLPLSKGDASPLFPLLTGLFGLPVLIQALGGMKIPEQEMKPAEEVRMRDAIQGIAAGGFVGWFPGITSTSGAVIGSLLSTRTDEDPLRSARRFITMVSAVGSSAAVFSLLALAVIRRGRTGAMLVVESVMGEDLALLSPPSIPFALLLLSALVGCVVGYRLTVLMGRTMARRVSNLNMRLLSILVSLLLLAMVLLLNGVSGLVVMSVSTLLGLIPASAGVSRVHLTGCLLIPLILFFSGLEPALIGLLGG